MECKMCAYLPAILPLSLSEVSQKSASHYPQVKLTLVALKQIIIVVMAVWRETV